MQVARILSIRPVLVVVLEHVPLAKQTSKIISKYGSHSEVQTVTFRSVGLATQGISIDETSQQQYFPFLISTLYRFWKCCT